jgi:tetratricopeptide (TPR) repeat protein
MKKIKLLIPLLFLSLHFNCYAQEEDIFYTLFINGQYEQLIHEARSCIKNDSLNTEVFYILGLTYAELSRYDSALFFLRSALTADSNNLKILSATGKTFTALGRYYEAINIYETIHQTDSSLINPRIRLANLYLLTHNYSKAIEQYTYLSGTDTFNYFYYKQLGRCYQDIGNFGLAIVNCLKAHTLNEQDLGIVSRLINLYLKKKDFNKGLELAHKGLGIDSTEPLIINYMIRLLKPWNHY